jgi:hypothetical protein
MEEGSLSAAVSLTERMDCVDFVSRSGLAAGVPLRSVGPDELMAAWRSDLSAWARHM